MYGGIIMLKVYEYINYDSENVPCHACVGVEDLE